MIAGRSRFGIYAKELSQTIQTIFQTTICTNRHESNGKTKETSRSSTHANSRSLAPPGNAMLEHEGLNELESFYFGSDSA